MNAEERAGILYVDDERGNRVVFEQSFARRYAVHVAESGEQALKLLEAGGYAVLVTDQRMPKMNGNELLERVRDLYPDIVRLVITAYSDLEPILKAVNEGLVARYIIKPWDRAELDRILAWALDVHRLGRVNSETQIRLLATERLATIGSISAAILHDVHQPLSYLSMNASRLGQLASSAPALGALIAAHRDRLREPDLTNLTHLAEELEGLAHDLNHGCDHLRGLTDTIRDLLHPVDNGELAVADVRHAVDFAISVCRPSAADARAQITYDGPEVLPAAAIALTSLMQSLINVLSNAVQAVARNDTSGGRVNVAVVVDDEWVALSISDNGPGMTADVLARVGTPFFSTRPEGTGLGLHQSRRLIEGAGGRLDIHSSEGSGTRVELRLPRHRVAR